MPHKLSTLAFFVTAAGIFVWLHIALALASRIALRSDDEALKELFAFAPFGRLLSRKPYLMRVNLWLPWVPVRSLQRYSTFIQGVAWSARLSGTAFLVCFIGIFGSLAYLFVSGA